MGPEKEFLQLSAKFSDMISGGYMSPRNLFCMVIFCLLFVHPGGFSALAGDIFLESARNDRHEEWRHREHRRDDGKLFNDPDFRLFPPREERDNRNRWEEHRNRRDGRRGGRYYDGRRYGDEYDRLPKREHNPYWERRNYRPARPMSILPTIHRLPSRHTVISHGKDKYHYHDGRYYRPYGAGFMLVRPPLGLMVFEIPVNSRTVVSSGITYHVFGDVYYLRKGARYEVVRPVGVSTSVGHTRVVVRSELLNVRYGPDSDEPVVAQVEYGDILRVRGSVPGWLLVEVPDEDIQGWVMEEFVEPAQARG